MTELQRNQTPAQQTPAQQTPAQLTPADRSLWTLDMHREQMHIEAGALGKFFGTGSNCAINITGLIILASLIAAVVITGISASNSAADPYKIWTYLTPIITGGLGFIFGKNMQKGE